MRAEGRLADAERRLDSVERGFPTAATIDEAKGSKGFQGGFAALLCVQFERMRERVTALEAHMGEADSESSKLNGLSSSSMEGKLLPVKALEESATGRNTLAESSGRFTEPQSSSGSSKHPNLHGESNDVTTASPAKSKDKVFADLLTLQHAICAIGDRVIEMEWRVGATEDGMEALKALGPTSSRSSRLREDTDLTEHSVANIGACPPHVETADREQYLPNPGQKGQDWFGVLDLFTDRKGD